MNILNVLSVCFLETAKDSRFLILIYSGKTRRKRSKIQNMREEKCEWLKNPSIWFFYQRFQFKKVRKILLLVVSSSVITKIIRCYSIFFCVLNFTIGFSLSQRNKDERRKNERQSGPHEMFHLKICQFFFFFFAFCFLEF